MSTSSSIQHSWNIASLLLFTEMQKCVSALLCWKVTCLSQDIYHYPQVLNYLSNNCSEFQPQILFSSHHINFYNSCHFDFYLDKTCPMQRYKVNFLQGALKNVQGSYFILGTGHTFTFTLLYLWFTLVSTYHKRAYIALNLVGGMWGCFLIAFDNENRYFFFFFIEIIDRIEILTLGNAFKLVLLLHLTSVVTI